MKKGDIAIIGMAGVYPEAADLAAFYKNLCEGRDSVREISEERKPFLLTPDDDYQVNGLLDRIDLFDHNYFMISRVEADYMDPHHRIALQLASHAIENAGYSLSHFAKSNTGVSVAAPNPGYRSFFMDVENIKTTGVHPANIVGRISNALDLWGPAMVIDTSCSSSLVAVIHACNELYCENADYMLAGGINLYFDFFRRSENQMGINSPDGKCRTFSSDARGTGWGEGGGMLLLKRYDDAVADKDNINAVIRGYANNQNGKRTIAISSPSSEAQTDVFIKALQKAAVDPEQLGYVEAHGTATPLGDPIEIQGLSNAIKKYTGKNNFCAIGSVKTNIGHLNVAAGIAGLIKMVLAVKNKKKFPSLHFTLPNPYIDFDNSPFFVNTALTEWDEEERVGAVNSLGINGSNSHVIVASAPEVVAAASSTGRELMLKVSAKSKSAFLKNIERLCFYLETATARLEDICYTLNNGRDDYKYRLMVTGTTALELAGKVRAAALEPIEKHYHAERMFNLLLSPDILLDTDYVVLLSRQFDIFREKFDLCVKAGSPDIPEGPLKVFAYQFALYHLLISKGVAIKEVFSTGFSSLVASVVTNEMTIGQAIKQIPGKIQMAAPFNQTGFSDYVKDCAGTTPSVFSETGRGGMLGTVIQKLTDAFPDIKIMEPAENKPVTFSKILAELYNNGVVIDWKKLYENENVRRIEAPVYCFDEISCWQTDTETGRREGTGQNMGVTDRQISHPWQQDTKAPAQTNDIHDALYTLKWVAAETPVKNKFPANTIFLVVADASGLAEQLIKALQEHNNTCVKIIYGNRFAETGDKEFEIDPFQEEHYTRLCSRLIERGIVPGGIMYLHDYAANENITADTINDIGLTGVNAQFLLYRSFVQAFSRLIANREFRIVHVSAEAQTIAGSQVDAYKHMGISICKTLLSSYPFIKINCIDTEYEKNNCSHIVRQVLNEISIDDKLCFVAYRKGIRYVQETEKLQVPQDVSENALYKQGGIYLVTGGAGGIGLELCKHIASKVKCRFLIVGRTVLPPQENTPLMPESSVKKVLNGLAQIRSLGSEVEYLNGDVGDVQSMRKIVSDVKGKYSHIDMIIHCAGIGGEYVPIEMQTISSFQKTLLPKVMGSVLLEELIQVVQPERFVLFSSLSSIIPGSNSFGYVAANAFLDAFACQLAAKGIKATAINWDMWVETGMAVSNVSGAVSGHLAMHGLKNTEGLQAFDLCLTAGCANTIVTKVDPMSYHNLPFFKVKQGLNKEEQPTDVYIEKSIAGQLSEIICFFLKCDSIQPDDDFFELGMHSLMGIHVTNKIKYTFGIDIDFDDLFTYSTIKQLAGYLEEQLSLRQAPVHSEIPKLPVQEHYALSSAQERLWILQHYEKRLNYNLGALFGLGSHINMAVFEKTFAALIDRHEILRTIFIEVNDEPRQKILNRNESVFGIEYVDLNENEDIGFQLKQMAANEANRVFDFSAPPLYRAKVFRAGEKNIAFLFTLHHIIFDAWSADILLKEFRMLYDAFDKGVESPLIPLGIQYKDFAAWQNGQLTAGQLMSHKQYWLDKLSGELPVLQLPTDYPRPEIKTYNAGALKFFLSENIKQQLLSFGKSDGGSLFMALVAIVKTLLYRYSAQEDIIVGTTVANRNHPDLENQIGFYVNVLPLRTRFNGYNTFTTLFDKVRKSVLEAFEHQAYPFALLVKDAHDNRDISRSPLFDVLVELAIDMSTPDEREAIARTEVNQQVSSTPYDLSFRFFESSNGIIAQFEYNTDLYAESSIQAIKEQFCSIIQSVASNPQITLNDVGLIDQKHEAFANSEKIKELFQIPDIL
jgi:acyl transferase domain-containing protein/acyl carrier protein